MKKAYLVFTIALTLGTSIAQGATLTIQKDGSHTEPQKITSTYILKSNELDQSILTIRAGTVECSITKAIAEDSGYTLGSLQVLIASSKDEVGIFCYGRRGSVFTGVAGELFIQTRLSRP